MPYETLLYVTNPPIATITLNRPDRLNTIVPPMHDELERSDKEMGLVTMCCGGGLGTGTLIQRV